MKTMMIFRYVVLCALTYLFRNVVSMLSSFKFLHQNIYGMSQLPLIRLLASSICHRCHRTLSSLLCRLLSSLSLSSLLRLASMRCTRAASSVSQIRCLSSHISRACRALAVLSRRRISSSASESDASRSTSDTPSVNGSQLPPSMAHSARCTCITQKEPPLSRISLVMSSVTEASSAVKGPIA
ncbi:hypothetical protein EDC01DRAFT_665158 [Geopyxis carbonaria]|nr:hypothetical protein EDC01DRAFT_665158 [Geopyxis carbonaria]